MSPTDDADLPSTDERPESRPAGASGRWAVGLVGGDLELVRAALSREASSSKARFLDRLESEFHIGGMPPDDREIYPNAPLEFVACEVRFPFSPILTEDVTLPRLHRAFYDWLPLIEPGMGVEATLVVGPGAVSQLPPATTTKQLRFLSRDRTLGVLVAPNLVSIETTHYPRFEAFKESIARTLDALAHADAGVAGLARIGLRYIDEVRVPGIDEVRGSWTEYIDERLAGPVGMTLAGVSPVLHQGTLQFDLGERQRVVIRYGAMEKPSVGNAPLRRREVAQQGAYFLIDIDSFWTAEDPIPEFSIDTALAMCDKLHQPVRELFEASVTERLREEVLRRVPGDD